MTFGDRIIFLFKKSDNLIFQDLELISSSAVMSSRRGQYGVFYSTADLLALKDHVVATAEVTYDMIP